MFRIIFFYLGGSYVSKWVFEVKDCEAPRPDSQQLISMFLNDNSLYSVSNSGILSQYDLKTGTKKGSVQATRVNEQVLCFDVDKSFRRFVVSYTDKTTLVLSSSASEIARIDIRNGARICKFFILNQQKYLILASVQIWVYEDTNSTEFHKLNCLASHTEEIFLIIQLKEKYIISIGIKKELFLWSPTSSIPLTSYDLNKDICSAVDILNDSESFVVGTSTGEILILSIASIVAKSFMVSDGNPIPCTLR